MVGIGSIELFILLIFSMGSQAGVPLGIPPGPEDPLISQFAPADCLFYTSWSPTIEADPSANVTERWMANPKIQASFNKLKAAIKLAATSGDSKEAAFGELAFEVAERCLTHACGFYVSEFKQIDFSPVIEGGALIHLGDDASEINEKMSSMIEGFMEEDGMKSRLMDIDGKKFRVLLPSRPGQPTIAWGIVHEEYLAITVGEGEMQNLVANLETDPPEWLRDLRDVIPVDRPAAITWVGIESVLDIFRDQAAENGAGAELDRGLEVTGIDGVKAIGWISGLDDQGFLCRGSIHVDGEPRGMLGVFNGEPLQADSFGKIASDRMVMTGMRISIPRVFSLIREISDLSDFNVGEFDRGVTALNEMLDIDIEEDVINTLDDHAYVYGSVNFTNPTAGWVLGIGASSQMELTDTYNMINELIKRNTEMSDQIEFQESEVKGNTIYGVVDKSEWNLMPNFSWTMADGELLISMDKSSLRRHLRRQSMADDALVKDPWFAENAFTPLHMDAEGPLMVASLDLSSLLKMGLPLVSTFGDGIFPPEFNFSFDDLPSLDVLTKDMKPSVSALFRTPDGFETLQRQTYPGGTPGTLLGIAAIGVMPATMEFQRASARTECANQMRQIILAMHNYHDANRAFPARFSKNDDDEPLLSWRVYILPYMEENDLYEQFHLDEPWDSEHNKTLIEKLPRCYVHPRALPEEGKTVFVVPAGEGSIMVDPEDSGRPKGMRLEDVLDGTSRTGVIFETDEENAVVWTKPDDFDWKKIDDPVGALFGGWSGDGVNVALADGSVQFISHEKLRELLDKLITTADGEFIDWTDDAPIGRRVIEGKATDREFKKQ